MAKKANRKAAKKSSTKPTKKAPAKAAAPDTRPLEPLVCQDKHQLHIHNVTKSTANWTLTGGGEKLRGCTPAAGESTARVGHCKKYKITFWGKDKKKKESANLGPDGSAIYNGRGVAVTHPH
jgi:hypothetical protein